MFTFASVVRRTLGGGGGGAPTEKKKRGTPGKPVYKQYGPGLKYASATPPTLHNNSR